LLTLRNCFAISEKASVNDAAAEMVKSPLSFEALAFEVACATFGTTATNTTATTNRLHRFNWFPSV
jgi:hypothetical protein